MFFCFVLVVGRVELINRVYCCVFEVVELAPELLEVVTKGTEQVAVVIF